MIKNCSATPINKPNRRVAPQQANTACKAKKNSSDSSEELFNMMHQYFQADI
jgi:hypothetical protein